MKFICVVALIVLSAVCGTANEINDNSSTLAPICEPHSIKMKECNRCKCSSNGLHWMCTRKACPNFMRRPNPTEENFVCTPNKTFNYECNTCTCNANGKGASCTEKACENINDELTIQSPKSSRLLPLPVTTTTASPSLPVGNECVPGTSFRKQCNTCFCTTTGIAICTLKGCAVGPINIPVLNQPRQRRQARSQYQPDNRVYTLADLNNPKFTCIPSHSFKLECNTCWCSADGRTPRYCTRLACNPKTYPTNIARGNSQ